jgi:hypothetical protein
MHFLTTFFHLKILHFIRKMSGGPVLRNSKRKKGHASKNKTPRANHFFAVQISDCQVSIKIQKHVSSLSVAVTFQFLADRGSSPQRSQDHIGAGTRVEQRPGVSINSPHHAGSCTPVQPRGFGQVIYVCVAQQGRAISNCPFVFDKGQSGSGGNGESLLDFQATNSTAGPPLGTGWPL